jgi:thiamine-phosphate pyrophosphorylase
MSISPELAALARAAERLAARAPVRNGRGLPPLLILTDPGRTPDPVALAERLPEGCGLVYRAFGAADAPEIARALATACRRRGLVFLIGADADLAAACGAAGVHLPERLAPLAPRLRARHPRWLLTGAAHGAPALRRAAAAGLDAALLSAVFPSRSPSAGPALGPQRFACLVRDARLPVYALGGVSAATVPRLRDAGAAGAAAVGAAAGRNSGDAPMSP